MSDSSNAKIKIYSKDQKIKKPYNNYNNMGFTPIYLKQNKIKNKKKIETIKNPSPKKQSQRINKTQIHSKIKLTKIKNALYQNRSTTPKPKKIRVKDVINTSHYSIYSKNKDYSLSESPLPDITLKRNKSNKSFTSNKENSFIYNKENNIPKQLQIIVTLKKKITEQNKLIEDKINEIESLRKSKDISKLNEFKVENDILKGELQKMKNIIENNKELKVNPFDLNNNNKLNEKEEIINKLKEEIQNLKKKLDEVNNKYIKELKEKEKLKKEKEELKKIKNELINKNKLFSDNLLKQENEYLEISKIEKKLDLETDRQISETVQGKEIIKEFENLLENGNEFNDDINNFKGNNQFIIDNLQIESSQFEVENIKDNKKENGINNENEIENNINIELFGQIKENDNKFNELTTEINNFQILSEYDYALTNFIFKTFSFLSQQEYNDIQKLLLLTYKALNLRNRDIENQFDSNENNKSIIFFQICKLFKINDNSLIERFMLSLSKSHQGFDFEKLKDNFIKIFQNKIELNNNISIKKFIKQLISKCEIYDYQKKGIVPYYYFTHIYYEICNREKIKNNDQDFWELIRIMKLRKKDSKTLYSLYNLNYLNLKDIKIEDELLINTEEEKENEEEKKEENEEEKKEENEEEKKEEIEEEKKEENEEEKKEENEEEKKEENEEEKKEENEEENKEENEEEKKEENEEEKKEENEENDEIKELKEENKNDENEIEEIPEDNPLNRNRKNKNDNEIIINGNNNIKLDDNEFDVHNSFENGAEIPHEVKMANQNELNKEITNEFLDNVFIEVCERYKKRKSSSHSSQSEKKTKPKNVL